MAATYFIRRGRGGPLPRTRRQMTWHGCEMLTARTKWASSGVPKTGRSGWAPRWRRARQAADIKRDAAAEGAEGCLPVHGVGRRDMATDLGTLLRGGPTRPLLEYVHQAAPHGEKAPALERLGGVFVPQVPTEWCAVFGLEAELLSRALEDPLNVQFVFVSGTTVPLKTFDYVYRHLAEGSPASSKFCLATPASHRLAYHEYLPQAIQTCFYRDFLSAMSPRTLKHHQWAVLAREHARIVVQRSMEALDIFWESWSTTISDVEKPDGCTDESVPLTALLHDIEAKGGSTGKVDSDLALLGVEEQCLTFVRWQNCMRGTEFDSGVFTDVGKLFSNTTGLWDLLTRQGTDAIKQQLNNFPTTFSEIDVVYLSNLVAEGFMFARKFPAQVAVHSPKGAVEFSEILPRLWAGVNETYAKQSVWKRLDAARRQ
eukprot:CAMPEP_0117474266 /NCGR_PEP_ID=MMETSP0784-20121206/9196_1 /TAXON_ID=39447 /ORGANISM="" /LENGTH=427 /DNA_ID=CAMNT_0005268487 /DNA_START=141 /DNA_END=1426 /DNA_ORIENTATION=-